MEKNTICNKIFDRYLLNEAELIITANEVIIRGNVENCHTHGHTYHGGQNPWDEVTTKTFKIGDVWLKYYYWGNYTSEGETLEEIPPQEKILQSSSQNDDDRGYRRVNRLAPKENIDISVPIEKVKVCGGYIGEILRKENEWREQHVIREKSIMPQVLEAIGRYSFVDDPKGIHDEIVKADADGKLYSVDVVVAGEGMGYLIYEAIVRDFDPEAEAAARKAFGRKAASLSKMTAVPFGIVKILAREQLESPEAQLMLKKLALVHRARKSPADMHELLDCGIARRTAAMQRLLPEEVYKFFKVNLLGQLRNETLAIYIAGRG